MQVRLLGPVDVMADGQVRPVRGLRRKAVLAALALHGGQVVSTGRLVDVVWGAAAPSTAVNTLQSHVSHLRAVMGCKAAIVARPPGYALDVGGEATDVQAAERLLRQGMRPGDPVGGVRDLSAALGLWRGRPLADVTGLAWLEEQAGRLDVLRLQVQRALFEARLAAGEHAQLVAGLERMAAGYPLDEQVHGLLMVALYRCGRQADALGVYRRLRATLSEELGIDPSQPLRDLETAILRQDPALDPPAPAAVPHLAAPVLAPAPPGTPELAPPGAPELAPPPAGLAAGGPGAVVVVPAATPAAAPELAPPAAAGLAGLVPAAASAAPAPAPAPVVPVQVVPVPVPAQLPPAVAGFAGRGAELAHLDSLLPPAGPAGAAGAARGAGVAAVVISAVSGTAGVGKTALAVQWAHRVAGRFPDGQLYVNLRGFDPGGPALQPGEAVRGFLDAFGVPVARIPPGLAAQAGLYRSLLAGKRVLVVLDNARDVEQVRPLLPGSPGCLVIVTSRSQLTGLVATEGARPLTLDLPTTAEARDLLTHRIGADRAAAEPAAVDDIIGRCARLPLALAIAAARAATNPTFPLAALAAELRQATSALDPFHGGDHTTDVRAVFSWSYRALPAPAARLFRLLGLHPGPDIAAAAAASLAAIPPGQARTLLAELTRAHLLTESVPGRYAFHDLLRAYATEQAHTHDSDQARSTAIHRVLDHYLHTAHRAAALMEPYLRTFSLLPAQPAVIACPPATAEDALCWFTAEHATLLAAVHLAARTGFHTCTWQLAWTLTTFLLRRGRWHDQETAQQAGLAAARRDGDTQGEAHALHGLALGYARSGRFDDARPLFEHALGLFEKISDNASQAVIHNSLTWLSERRQRPADALSHALRTYELYGAAQRWDEQAFVLNDIGYCHALLGNYPQALDHCERALAATQQMGQPGWEEATWHSLGYIHHRLGSYQQAVACYARSIDMCRELADRYNEAVTLDHLGDVHHSAGDADAARRVWTDALRIFGEIDHPDGDQVRAKLHPRGPGRQFDHPGTPCEPGEPPPGPPLKHVHPGADASALDQDIQRLERGWTGEAGAAHDYAFVDVL